MQTLMALMCIDSRTELGIAAAKSLAKTAMPDGWKICVYALASYEHHVPVFDELKDDPGVIINYAINKPVNRKWQNGVKYAIKSCPELDALMLVGCDDFIPEQYIAKTIEALDTQWSVATPECYFLTPGRERLVRYRWNNKDNLPLGVGRTLRRDALDRTGHVLWPWDARNRGLDGYCSRHIGKKGVRFEPVEFGIHVPVDVKGEGNITDWNRLDRDFSDNFVEVLSGHDIDERLEELGLNIAIAPFME